MHTARAVAFTEPGDADALHVVQVTVPDPGREEVLVRVTAAAVHPSDIAVRAGAMPIAGPPPHVPGMAFAGTVEQAGPGSRWRPGDRVMGMALPSSEYGGAYRERLVTADDTLAAVPTEVDLAAAATLPMNGHTATQALRVLQLPAGATVVVTGAAGALGALFVPLAAAAGLRVIGVCADADRWDVLGRGADAVLTRGDDLPARILAHHGGPVDAVVDLAVLDGALLEVIRPGGVLATFRGWRGPEDAPVRVVPVMVPAEWRSGRQLEVFTEPRFLTRPVERFAPEDAAAAHRRVAGGGLRAGVVIDFG